MGLAGRPAVLCLDFGAQPDWTLFPLSNVWLVEEWAPRLHRAHPAQPLADGHHAGNVFQAQHRQQRLVVPLKPVHIVQPELARVPRQNECPDINRGRQAPVAAGLGKMPVDTCREAQAVHQLRRRQQACAHG